MKRKNEEIWKPIIIEKNGALYDYSGRYEVSNYGRVRSLDRLVFREGSGVKLEKGKVLKLSIDKWGYQVISLWIDGKSSMFKVHRLVATMFLDNPNGLELINHKDENPSNNVVIPGHPELSNLEWCDAKYNRNYGGCIEKQVAAMKNNDPDGERYKKALETKKEKGSYGAPKEILKIDPITNEVVSEYMSMTEATKANGNNWHISDAARGRRNLAAGFKWKYKVDYYGE